MKYRLTFKWKWNKKIQHEILKQSELQSWLDKNEKKVNFVKYKQVSDDSFFSREYESSFTDGLDRMSEALNRISAPRRREQRVEFRPPRDESEVTTANVRIVEDDTISNREIIWNPSWEVEGATVSTSTQPIYRDFTGRWTNGGSS